MHTLHLRYLKKNKLMDTTRRAFIKNTMAAGAFFPLVNLGSININGSPERLKVYIFSKHLQFLNYKELAEAAAEMGFDGIDLSVRPNGHVTPERVEYDLPKAAEEIKKVGFKPSLMTTAVNAATNATDHKLLSTAARLGFSHYRMNWYNFPDNTTMPQAINEMAKSINGLGELNKQLGLIGYYQNHAGLSAGSVIWEVYEMIKNANRQHMGAQYDIRHAMVEGAESWENGLRLIHDRIKMISLKDFRWKQDNGKWKVEDVPIGDGMINFKHYFSLLKKYNVNVPVSLHIEYDLGGAEKGNSKITIDRTKVFAAMKKDLQKIHSLWQEA